MNTGSGKTVVGLIMLQSCLNEEKGPAIYVVPDNYLVKQVIDEAKRLGISATEDKDDYSYSNSKAILVTLGLFSIVQMERDAQILIPAYDYCIPDRECNCNTSNPCETFQGIDFPVEQFFPNEKENCSPCAPKPECDKE